MIDFKKHLEEINTAKSIIEDIRSKNDYLTKLQIIHSINDIGVAREIIELIAVKGKEV